ncbi:MAG: hypothetical protein FJZ63_02620, partial [Chlamydiae bacterium]|nr:hypothetical protein [Chlamydiota bacterium]
MTKPLSFLEHSLKIEQGKGKRKEDFKKSSFKWRRFCIMREQNWKKMKSLAQIKKIIVRMPNWVGDFVMATALLQDIKEKFPQAEITVMCKEFLRDLVLYEPCLHSVFTFKEEKDNRVADLRARRYDLGILLTNSFSSAWWFWLGGVKNRLGYKGQGRSLLLSTGVSFSPHREKQHLTLTYKELLKPLGIDPSDKAPQLLLLEEEKKIAYARLARCGVLPYHS